MIVAGLTGSIGMGKSNAAQALRRLGVPVHDADAAVHRLLGPGGAAVRRVAELFPKALAGNRIDRKILGDQVFGDTPALRRLEAILHPLVRRSSRAFVTAGVRRRLPVVVLDIPLLYESRGEKSVDIVIVVSAPSQVQRQRVLSRPGMTEEKFRAILARQVPDAEKRRRADYVVRTGGHRGDTYRQLQRIVAELRILGRAGRENAMNPGLVAAAPLALKIHMATVIPAFFVGTWLIFFSTKGARFHRLFGVIYLVLMTITAVDALFVQVINPGHWSLIHLFVLVTLSGIVSTVLALRRGNIAAHKRSMVGVYIGGLLIAGAFTFVPGRLMHGIFFG